MSPPPLDLWTQIAQLGHTKHRHEWGALTQRVREQLAAGANPDAGREPPLLMAAKMGHLAIAELLLDFGADIHAGREWRTPLLAAGRNAAMRTLLLARGAEDTAFCFLVNGEMARLERALAADPELARVADEDDRTLLFYAAGSADRAAMVLLLDAGADPRAVAPKSYGVSPIHELCRGRDSGGAAEIALLHQRGADLDAANQGGGTPLHMAGRDRNADTVQALLELGAAVDPEDHSRRSTPLRRAVANTGRAGAGGKKEHALRIVTLLLDAGADPGHRNRTGKTVHESAVDPEIKRLLSGQA